MKGLEFNVFTSPADYLRLISSRGLDVEKNKEGFYKIYAQLKAKFVVEDIEREKYLERKREELAALVKKKHEKLKIEPEQHKNKDWFILSFKKIFINIIVLR